MTNPIRTSGGARLSCQSCGEALELTAGPGIVAQLRFEHDADCAFLKAIKDGRGQQWFEKHGDPMCIEKT